MINVPQIVLSIASTIKFNIAMWLNLIHKPNIQLQHLQITYEKIIFLQNFIILNFKYLMNFSHLSTSCPKKNTLSYQAQIYELQAHWHRDPKS